MNQTLNLSAYRFVDLADAVELRERIHAEASARRLKGTVLLATEGINLFLAGKAHDARGFMDWLREDSRFADLQARESWSADTPFRKLLVKVKREIIRMNHPAIQPQSGRAPSVDAQTLKRWLDNGCDDQGKPVVLLDTRNDFEVDAGAFDAAIDWRLTKFTEFPAALEAHASELEAKTVVSYCTGGIRCEKATLLMAEAGVDHVLQLEGGILKYLELTDGTHFHGHCFVFDERRLVNARLEVASESAQP
ncbi:MAG: hypothetical protein JWQ11_3682 [Rhizobacter sp.]|nr:hypothetical protein [Rhizobacter sp.]